MSQAKHNGAKRCRRSAARAISNHLPHAFGMVIASYAMIFCLPGTAAAQEVSSTDMAKTKQEQARIDLTVPLNLNERYVGDVSISVDMVGIGDIDMPRLLNLLEPILGKAVFAELELMANGRKTVSMTELSSDKFTIEFDPGLLEVTVKLAVSELGENTIGLVSRPTPEPSEFDTPESFTAGLGVTVNQGYVFSGEDDDRFTPIRANFDGYVQMGGFDGAALFYEFDIEDNKDKVFRRDEVQLIKDFYKPAIRAAVGDVNAPLTAFQAAPPLLGVSVGREYRSIQPFQNIISSGRGSLTLERDSKVDVYVNGVLAETLNLSAGRFALTDFPVATGSNDVQLVIEDETGRVETTDFSFFSQSGLLAEGLIDFSASAGVSRSPSSGGFNYGKKPIATGFVDYGLTSWLTVGVNGQARDERQQFGASAAVGTPLGLFTFDAAKSQGEGGLSGTAFGADYRRNFDIGTTQFSANGSVIRKSREFSGINLGSVDNTKLTVQTLLRAQFDNGLSLGVSGSLRDEFDREDEKRANLNIGKYYGHFYVNLSCDYVKTDGLKEEYEGSVSLTYRLGDRHNARAQYNMRNNAKLLEFVRSRRRELKDISGRVQISQADDANRLLSEINYRHNRFDAELDFDVIDPRGSAGLPTASQAKWRVSSFIGFTGGQIGIGRRSDEGFVLASRHKSLKGSTVAVMDQSGRRTEAKIGALGAALVPIERAYTPRQYSLDVDPLPSGYDVGITDIDVLPGLGMGYSYQIGSDASRTLLGTLKNADGEPLKLAVGSLEDVTGNADKTRQFFTNSAGRMVAERVSPGTYVLIVDGRKSDPIEIEENTEGLVNVGEIILP